MIILANHNEWFAIKICFPGPPSFSWTAMQWNSSSNGQRRFRVLRVLSGFCFCYFVVFGLMFVWLIVFLFWSGSLFLFVCGIIWLSLWFLFVCVLCFFVRLLDFLFCVCGFLIPLSFTGPNDSWLLEERETGRNCSPGRAPPSVPGVAD